MKTPANKGDKNWIILTLAGISDIWLAIMAYGQMLSKSHVMAMLA